MGIRVLIPNPFLLLFDPPVGQTDDPVGLVGDGPIVRNHHYSQVLPAVQATQRADDFLAGGLIEIPGGLVGQEEVGLGHQRPGDGRPLHFPPG